MRRRSATEEELYQRFQPEVQDLGLALIDVQLTKEQGKRFLRLLIDQARGVSIQDCERVSLRVDPILDQDYVHLNTDYFEVQSAGLERPLETDLDLELHTHQPVEVRLYQKWEGQKTLHAILRGKDQDQVLFELEDGREIGLPRSEIAKIQQELRFDRMCEVDLALEEDPTETGLGKEFEDDQQ